MGRRKKKKDKKEKAVTICNTTTTTEKKWWPTHNHAQWVDVGSYKVWLKSSYGFMSKELDIYIDLTGYGLRRNIPAQLAHILPAPKPIRMEWEIDDGRVCDELPGYVIILLKAGYKVGWGCSGGHGRTGWLAAKVHQLLTKCSGRDAVNHIRANYCIDAVETMVQLRDLGVFDIAATKGGLISDQDFEEDDDDLDYFGSVAEVSYNKYLKQWDKTYGKDNGAVSHVNDGWTKTYDEHGRLIGWTKNLNEFPPAKEIADEK